MINRTQAAIDKAAPILFKYQAIMDLFHKVDVSTDEEFQKLFNGFHRIRQRDEKFCQTFYSFMQKHKKHGTTYEKTLKHLHSESGRMEDSLSSVLLSTINPDMPVWDDIVLEKLSLKKPQQNSRNRFDDTVMLYTQIHNWYRDYTKSSPGKEIVSLFDQTYPGTRISDVKKLEFVLSQIRE